MLAAVKGVQTVLQEDNEAERLKRGYCIVRPPGHHSKCGDSAGFCIFNNVAIAAQYAKSQGHRVCVFDWDIHHGDGTQAAFYDDDQVLFISMHRCDSLSFYPYSKEMLPEYIGEGKGTYFNINVAWQTGQVVDEINRDKNTLSDLGNNEYRYACDHLLFPIVEEFAPDVIIISCGFDGGIHDFLGWSRLSPLLYGYLTHKLNKICDKILVVQEGGYNVDFLGMHASGVVSALIRGPGKAALAQSNGKNSQQQEDYSWIQSTEADHDVGINSISQIDASKAKAWAIKNVE